MEKHPNILMKRVNIPPNIRNKTRRLERKLKTYVPDHTVIYKAYATGYMLFKSSINCQKYH